MSVPDTAARRDSPVVARLAEIGSSRGVVLAEGACGTVLGVLVLAWPGPTATVIAVLVGVQFLIAGVLQFVAALSDAGRARAHPGRGLSCVLGTLSLLAGLLCLRHPLQVVTLLGLLIGVAWTVGGVIRVVQGIVDDRERGWTRAWRIVAGGIWVIAGGAVLLYPSASIAFLTSLLGVVLIIDGACLLAAGFTMGRAQAEPEPVAAVEYGSAPLPAIPRPAVPRPAVPPTARL